MDLKSVVALCKRRGFVFPGSEIYGGFANTYSYGPYGVELKRNIRELWWKRFVHKRPDMVGLDGPILLHPNVWKASGHVDSFKDALVDCKACKKRFRVDHLIEEQCQVDVEGWSLEKIADYMRTHAFDCPSCKKRDWTEPRNFNLMFQTQLSKTDSEGGNCAYLRPETAQAIFIDFKNVCDSMRVKLPFGIAQIGKAFRNEITPGNFVFRLIEFEQMEIEYFIEEQDWEATFDHWLKEMYAWATSIGLKPEHLEEAEHAAHKRSHYSKRTVDINYRFPFGSKELYGLAYRTNYDLSQHEQHAHQKLGFILPNGERVIPHVIEPTFGLDRTLMAVLCEAYDEEALEGGDKRTVLRFVPQIAPVKVAIFPLVKKPEFVEAAEKIHAELSALWNCEIDVSGNIGKRYRRQDELGTPICLTVDYQTLEDGTLTLRDRDTMAQERVARPDLISALMKVFV